MNLNLSIMGSITTTAAIERLLYLGENLDVTSVQQMSMAKKVRPGLDYLFFMSINIWQHRVSFRIQIRAEGLLLLTD